MLIKRAKMPYLDSCLTKCIILITVHSFFLIYFFVKKTQKTSTMFLPALGIGVSLLPCSHFHNLNVYILAVSQKWWHTSWRLVTCKNNLKTRSRCFLSIVKTPLCSLYMYVCVHIGYIYTWYMIYTYTFVLGYVGNKRKLTSNYCYSYVDQNVHP